MFINKILSIGKKVAVELPNFDVLLRLADENPNALGQLRQELIQQHIADAPESYRENLERLQFKIDAVIRRAGDPEQNCMLLNGMLLNNTATLLKEMASIPRQLLPTVQAWNPKEEDPT